MKVGVMSSDAATVALIRRILRAATATHEVTWVARDAPDAVTKIEAQPPDVLLVEIAGDGPGAVRTIMTQTPVPILLLAASITEQAAQVFEAIGAGAVDVATLIDADGRESRDAAVSLVTKLEMFRKLKPAATASAAAPARGSTARPSSLVLLGASAGGPSALAAVLSELPAGFAAPVVIVQHIDEQFVGGMAEWLSQHCQLPVRLAQDRERMENGVVYVAGRSEHLTLADRNTFQYTPEPRDHPYKPSIDVMFMSAARFWKDDAVAVLLTGMGQDGAAGLRRLREAGALTITQDKESSVVFGIPKAAARMQAAVEILPLKQIAARIRRAIPTPA